MGHMLQMGWKACVSCLGKMIYILWMNVWYDICKEKRNCIRRNKKSMRHVSSKRGSGNSQQSSAIASDICTNEFAIVALPIGCKCMGWRDGGARERSSNLVDEVIQGWKATTTTAKKNIRLAATISKVITNIILVKSHVNAEKNAKTVSFVLLERSHTVWSLASIVPASIYPRHSLLQYPHVVPSPE